MLNKSVMNSISHHLKISCSLQEIEEILQCLTHSILFQRLLGTSKTNTRECKKLKISYPCINDPSVIETVTSQIDKYISCVHQSFYKAPIGTVPLLPQYSVSLYTNIPGILSVKKKIILERWLFNINFTTMSFDIDTEGIRMTRLKNDVNNTLLKINETVSNTIYDDYFPPLLSTKDGYKQKIEFEVGMPPSLGIFERIFKHIVNERQQE